MPEETDDFYLQKNKSQTSHDQSLLKSKELQKENIWNDIQKEGEGQSEDQNPMSIED